MAQVDYKHLILGFGDKVLNNYGIILSSFVNHCPIIVRPFGKVRSLKLIQSLLSPLMK